MRLHKAGSQQCWSGGVHVLLWHHLEVSCCIKAQRSCLHAGPKQPSGEAQLGLWWQLNC